MRVNVMETPVFTKLDKISQAPLVTLRNQIDRRSVPRTSRRCRG